MLLLADCYVQRDEVALIAFRGLGAEILLSPTNALAVPAVLFQHCLAADRHLWPPASPRPFAWRSRNGVPANSPYWLFSPMAAQISVGKASQAGLPPGATLWKPQKPAPCKTCLPSSSTPRRADRISWFNWPPPWMPAICRSLMPMRPALAALCTPPEARMDALPFKAVAHSAPTRAARPGRPDWTQDGKDWPNRAASRFYSAGGITWHVQITGQGPVLLLVHGTGAATHSWRDLLPPLRQNFTVIAPDLPGHGFTSQPDKAGMTLPGMARGIAGLLR